MSAPQFADYLRRQYEAGDPLARRILGDALATVRLPPRFVTGLGRGLRGFSSSWGDEQGGYEEPEPDEWTPQEGGYTADPMPQDYAGDRPFYWEPGRLDGEENWRPGRQYNPYQPIPNADPAWYNPSYHTPRPMPQPPTGPFMRSREAWAQYEADLARWHEENPYALQ